MTSVICSVEIVNKLPSSQLSKSLPSVSVWDPVLCRQCASIPFSTHTKGQ